MARDILPTASSTPAAPPATPGHTPPPQAELPLERDALAGALPAWDLLPTAPFVRRVK